MSEYELLQRIEKLELKVSQILDHLEKLEEQRVTDLWSNFGYRPNFKED